MEEIRLKKGLKYWFIIHFFADILVAVPLLLVPQELLTFLGWKTVDPVAARLVAAALFAIGIESWLARNSSLESFLSMLDLKIIWSGAAILGFVINLIQNIHSRPQALWAFLAIFTGFNIVWIYWRVQLKKLFTERQKDFI
ncbi:MAG: hypothetical protein RBT69_11940 [Spirochaetia bacterium]|jgi:hypothetical protein|nr:hypothetical protein [Spirochaetia bacterium]